MHACKACLLLLLLNWVYLLRPWHPQSYCCGLYVHSLFFSTAVDIPGQGLGQGCKTLQGLSPSTLCPGSYTGRTQPHKSSKHCCCCPSVVHQHRAVYIPITAYPLHHTDTLMLGCGVGGTPQGFEYCWLCCVWFWVWCAHMSFVAQCGTVLNGASLRQALQLCAMQCTDAPYLGLLWWRTTARVWVIGVRHLLQ